MTGTPHTTPGGQDPAAEARRLGEELERARRAGSPVPYETLAALAARLSDLGATVRHLDAVVDRSGLVMAKDIRDRVGHLTAEASALGARLQDVEDQVAKLASKGARVPAANWPAMDQSTRAAELARLAEWVTRVLVPSQAWPRGRELRSPRPRVPHLCFPCTCQPARWHRPGNRGRAEESNPRARSNNERPLGRPAPGVRLIRGLNRTKKETTSQAVPPPFFTPVQRRASGTKG